MKCGQALFHFMYDFYLKVLLIWGSQTHRLNDATGLRCFILFCHQTWNILSDLFLCVILDATTCS